MRWAWHNMTHLAFALLACGSSEGSQTAGGERSSGGSGGAGASAAGTSGSSGGGIGSASGGSVGGSVTHPPCPQDVTLSGKAVPDPRVRETYSGLNGTFTDTCENGNLVQYECESSTGVGPDYDPVIYTSYSGEVVSTNVDCDGRCTNGACPNACPAPGDQLRCVSIDPGGVATFESLSSGWTYACTINAVGGCQTMPVSGNTVDVTTATSALATSRDCVADVGFSVGMGSEPSCWFNCTSTAP
jgi:hypothetical protein